MSPYPVAVERKMKRLYRSLRENDRRRYAAIEAAKLGHGGTEHIAGLLGCGPKTIRQGIGEREAEDELDTQRVRKKGRTQAGDGGVPTGVGAVRGRSPPEQLRQGQQVVGVKVLWLSAMLGGVRVFSGGLVGSQRVPSAC
jgi:hypothetical protein